jgi:hypothetical protein
MRTKPLALTAALGLGLALAVAAPAQAAESVQLTTRTSSTNGYANLGASLAFTDQGRGINLSGSIADRCPADGNGAYAIITVRFVGGGFQTYTPQDANGCGGPGSGNDFHHVTDFNVRITSVSFLLQERDNGSVVRSVSTVVYNS